MSIDKPVIRWDGSGAELYIGDSLVKNNWYVEINCYDQPPAAGGTIENTNGMALVGDGGGCDLVALPNGATVVQIDLSCDGPACQANEFYSSSVWYHLFVVPGRITGRGYRFCSLMCLANWLAAELAKEEGK